MSLNFRLFVPFLNQLRRSAAATELHFLTGLSGRVGWRTRCGTDAPMVERWLEQLYGYMEIVWPIILLVGNLLVLNFLEDNIVKIASGMSGARKLLFFGKALLNILSAILHVEGDSIVLASQ
ncbi:MAG: hypothetical protein IPJ49_14145 [Candidatus Obscuribacter sp.]|nr:hypothetical protein [Candidatus Obscuribacter sp.]